MNRRQLSDKIDAIHAKFEGSRIDIGRLLEDELFALLAWELWKDGRDWDDDLEKLAGGVPDTQFRGRPDCINFLVTVFGYGVKGDLK